MSKKKKRNISKGSGKRDESKQPRRKITPVRRAPPPRSYTETALRKRISQFGLSQRFREDFDRALEQYLGPEVVQRRGAQKILMLEEEEEEAEFPGFQEWFFFDYGLASGDTIIDLFAAEIGPNLPPGQSRMLEDWLATNRLRLFETQSIEPGVGETMQDLLNREILHLKDISFSNTATRWSVALVRPLLTEGRWSFTGSGILLTPFEKPAILKAAQDLWSIYQQRNPHASLLDFYSNHSLELRNAAKSIQAESRKPKALLTPEGHPAVAARADFMLRVDLKTVESALDQTEEFIFQNEENKGEFAGSLHYIWLLRGRSNVPQAPKERAISLNAQGLMLAGSWTAGPGEPDFPTLGDLNLGMDRLTLTCLSCERLEAGKKLLDEILGRKIDHLTDQVGDLRQSWDKSDVEDAFEEDEEYRAESDVVAEETIERSTLRWLDTPDKNGISPRASSQTPEGRELLRETIKSIEYLADEALASGRRPPTRLDIIRGELGL